MNLSEAIEKARLCEGNPPPNESCTCDWVIVPILHSLGYDHFDIVSRGADNQNQFPDYTILKGTSCEWFLEAKAWSVHLADNHAGQALNYANQNGRRWVVLSNGKEWRLYDNDIRGTSAEKLVAMARLSNDEEIRPFLDSISKDSVTSGRLEVQAQGFRLASTLNAQMKDADSDVVKAIAKALRSKGLIVKTGDVVAWFAGRSRSPQKRIIEKTSAGNNDNVPYSITGERKSLAEWRELCKANWEVVSGGLIKEISFPDGLKKTVTKWSSAAEEIIVWFGERNILPTLPWKPTPQSKRYHLVASPDTASGGKPRYERLSTGGTEVWYDSNTASGHKIVIWYALCQAVGIDPAQVFITIQPKEEGDG